MDMTKMMIDAYMKPLYDMNPSGQLLSDIQLFEKDLYAFAADNPGAVDIVGESGKRDVYNSLYMDAMSGGGTAQAQTTQMSDTESADEQGYNAPEGWKLPTVGEFLYQYRHVYETSVKPYNRPLTEAAYQRLFDVENRTDDLLEAQMIIEKEGLLIDTVTADYKNLVKDFMEAVDPNYEVTSATTKATLGVYAEAKSLEEITYMGEVASATCDDIAVQIKLKVEMMTVLTSLLFAWENSKRKIRECDPKMDKYAQAMVVTRKQLRRYYRFLSEDMGLTYDKLESTPFYMISLLQPEGLDALWRIKKVMHPDNLKAMRYALFEEVLSDKTMEEILMGLQPYPYYESLYTNRYPEMQEEYLSIASELNKDIKYFKDNTEVVRTPDELADKARNLVTIVNSDGDSKKVEEKKERKEKGLLKGLFRK